MYRRKGKTKNVTVSSTPNLVYLCEHCGKGIFSVSNYFAGAVYYHTDNKVMVCVDDKGKIMIDSNGFTCWAKPIDRNE